MREFGFSYRLNQTPQTVVAFLLDLRSFGAAHPLMDGIEPFGQNRYRVREFVRLPFGLKLRFTYEVLLTRKSEFEVEYAGRAATPFVIMFRVFPERQGSRIEEFVQVDGPAIIAAYLQSLMRKSHAEIFARLDQR